MDPRGWQIPFHPIPPGAFRDVGPSLLTSDRTGIAGHDGSPVFRPMRVPMGGRTAMRDFATPMARTNWSTTDAGSSRRKTLGAEHERPRPHLGSAAVSRSCSKSVRKGVWTLMLLLLSMGAEPRAAQATVPATPASRVAAATAARRPMAALAPGASAATVRQGARGQTHDAASARLQGIGTRARFRSVCESRCHG